MALKASLAERPDGIVLMVLRIVDFAALNAAWGRQGGNAVLRAVGQRLAAHPKLALAARSGGTEFAATLPSASAERLLATIGGVLRQCGRPVDREGHDIRFAVSAGAVSPLPGERPGAMVDRARAAANAAPAGGVAWWGTSERTDDERLAIDLRRALDSGEIAVLFQPQIDRARGMGADAVFGVEALARWHHATLGPIDTARLFAVAGRSSFASHLTDHLLRQTLDMATRWSDAFAGLRLAVNVSARDLARPDFVRRLADRLFVAGVDPARMTVEITEDIAMDQPVETATAIAALRALGCRVVLDDFGTGQSSLAWLSRLSIDGIKFDRGFTAGLTTDPRTRSIMESLIALAGVLDLSVVAEGVETVEEARLLRQFGCQHHQGFLYARPMPAEQLAHWLTSGGELREAC